MVLNVLGISRADQKLWLGDKLVEGGPCGNTQRMLVFPKSPCRGWTGTLKRRVIYFGFKQVFFTSSDFVPKQKPKQNKNQQTTLNRLPTHCIIHYPSLEALTLWNGTCC